MTRAAVSAGVLTAASAATARSPPPPSLQFAAASGAPPPPPHRWPVKRPALPPAPRYKQPLVVDWEVLSVDDSTTHDSDDAAAAGSASASAARDTVNAAGTAALIVACCCVVDPDELAGMSALQRMLRVLPSDFPGLEPLTERDIQLILDAMAVLMPEDDDAGVFDASGAFSL